MSSQVLLIAGAAALLALVVAAGNWRYAFLMVLLLGFSQDVIRKLTPGEPVELVLLSSVMVVVAVLVAMSRVGVINLRPLTNGDKSAVIVLTGFIALVFMQALMSFVRYKSVTIPAIGLISYLAPVPAIWLAYKYVRAVPDLVRFVRLYVLLASIVAVSIVLEKVGVKSRLFEEVGAGLVIYDVRVGLLEAYNGFMRTPEVAAWHLGAAACFLIILAVSTRRAAMRWITPPLVIGLLTVAMLTGRRKVLIVVASFAVLYFALMMYFRQRSGTRAMAVFALTGVVVLTGSAAMVPEKTTVDPYVGRGVSVFADATGRFEQFGINAIGSALQSAGPWGLGAGAVGQGSQYFGGAQGAVRGAAEGGLGKVVAELGVPGLVLLILSALFVVRRVRQVLSEVANRDPDLLRFCLGLLAFCAGNVPVFAGAAQIYGDPFVLFILGTCMGFVLAGPRVIDLRQRALSAKVAPPQLSPVPVPQFQVGR